MRQAAASAAVNKAAIDWAIDTMTPVDPMSYKPALTAAYNALQHTNARIKHIIVLGDGDAENSYSALVTRIHKAGITISTMATGRGTYGFAADYGTMQNIARWGGANLCIADVDNQRVCEVTTSGTMSTVAVPGRRAAALPGAIALTAIVPSTAQ